MNFLVCELDVRVCVQATSMYVTDHHASFYTDEQTYYLKSQGLTAKWKNWLIQKGGGKERVAREDKKRK